MCGTLRRNAATDGRGNFSPELPRPSLEAQGRATLENQFTATYFHPARVADVLFAEDRLTDATGRHSNVLAVAR